MQLFTFFRSSAAYRVRIALNFKGIAYQPVPIDLRPGAHRQPEYLARNPQGLVPALADGGTVIGQSLAIIEYLEETHPAPPLLPREPSERAQVRAMALAIACDLHPLNNLRVLNYLRGPLGQDEQSVNTWYRHWVGVVFEGLETQARAHSDARTLFAGGVTLADVCLVPQLFNARRFSCDLAPFPTLTAVGAYLETLPAFAQAAPAAQPDAS